MRAKLLYIAIGFFLFVAHSLHGQRPLFDRSQQVVIFTKDGNRFKGTVMRQTDSTVIISSPVFREIAIKVDQIRHVRGDRIQVAEIMPPRDVPELTPKHFLAPTAHPTEETTGYYQNGLVFFNHLEYNIHKNLHFGFGGSPLLLFAGESVFWTTLRTPVNLVKDQLSFGPMGAIGYSTFEYDYFAFLNLPITIGSRSNNFTFSGGFARLSAGSGSKSPLLGFSVHQRIGPTVVLISENYHLPALDNRASCFQNGIRLVFRRGGAIDFHAIIVTGTFDTMVLPWVSFAVPFG